MNAPFLTTAEPAWQHPPSEKHWQVMVYGGTDPRTGLALAPLEFQYFFDHHTRRQIIGKAEWLAEREHRTRFMVRDTNGEVVHRGICALWDRDTYLAMLSKAHRTFQRTERRNGSRA